MSGNLIDIDMEGVEESGTGEYALLPDGKYLAIMTKSEVVPTKAGTGEMLKATFTIFDEKYAGRLVFHNFNIKNASEKAQQIGLGQLKSCYLAMGLKGLPADSSELHDLPLIIKVGKSKPSEGYAERNEIKGFYSSKPKDRAANDETEELPDFMK
jgi:hypothetical protein